MIIHIMTELVVQLIEMKYTYIPDNIDDKGKNKICYLDWNVIDYVAIFLPEFGVFLAEITVDRNGALAIRQLASVLLKQYVQSHWCEHSEKFRAPEASQAVSFTWHLLIDFLMICLLFYHQSGCNSIPPVSVPLSLSPLRC